MHCVLFNIERDGKVFNLLVGSDEVAYELGMPAFADCKPLRSTTSGYIITLRQLDACPET